MNKDINDLFQYGGGVYPPEWFPVYDFAAYMQKADDECGYGSEYMAAKWFITTQIDEYQAIVDLCAAFQGIGFTSNSHYRVKNNDPALIVAALEKNAQQACPGYRGLFELMIGSGILEKKSRASDADSW